MDENGGRTSPRGAGGDAAESAHPADPWRGHRESPRIVRDARAAGWGADFQEVEYGPSGSWNTDAGVLHVAALLTPARHRVGPAGRPFRPMQPSSAVARPGDRLHGGWSGTMRGRHLFVPPALYELLLDEPGDGAALARQHFAPQGDTPGQTSLFLSRMLEVLALDLRAGSPAGPALGEAAIAAILHHLRASPRRAVIAPRRTGLSARQLAAVRDVIDAEIAGRPSLATLAAAAGLSVQHLCRAFRASTGTSPHQFILCERVRRARMLLEQGQLGHAEVAEAVGFADRSQMATTFRRVLGASPSHFRNTAAEPID